MISNRQILLQIEKQLQEAKAVSGDQSIRESLAAIKALCDVALTVPLPESPKVHVPSTMMVTKSNVLTAPSTTLKEEDANGESLFDF